MKEKSFTLVQVTAEDHSPLDSFINGSEDSFFYKLDYAAPYESFKGISNYQIKERRANIYGVGITVFIDLSDWLDHENEQYLYIFSAFIADNMRDSSFIFYAESKEEEKIKELFKALRKTMRGELILNSVERVVESVQQSTRFDRAAKAALIELIKMTLPEKPFCEKMLDRVADEINDGQSGPVDIEKLTEYAAEDNSLFAVFGCEKELSEIIKTKENENDGEI